MAAADYALCDSCAGKVFYDADTDIPPGTVILHPDCMVKELAKVRGEQAVDALHATGEIIAAEIRGYRKAIADLRDDEAYHQWIETMPPEAWAQRIDDNRHQANRSAADFLESRRPTRQKWSMPPEPTREVKAVKSTAHGATWIWRRTEDNLWDAAGMPCSWTHLVSTFSSPEHPLSEVVDTDA